MANHTPEGSDGPHDPLTLVRLTREALSKAHDPMAIYFLPAVETDELMILSNRNTELQTESSTEVEFPVVGLHVHLLACFKRSGGKKATTSSRTFL